jgi:hypothetical protein
MDSLLSNMSPESQLGRFCGLEVVFYALTLMSRGQRIDGRTAGPLGVLRQMRGDLPFSQGLDKLVGVVGLVSA